MGAIDAEVKTIDDARRLAVRYQPPPLVKKRRMKRSCSEWELLVFCPSMATSQDEGETPQYPADRRDRTGRSSI